MITTTPPAPTPDRPVPYNLEAEAAVLGALLVDRDAIVKIAPFLEAHDFYRTVHGQIYAAIHNLYTARTPADTVLLADELTRRGQLEGVGGAAYLVHLWRSCPTAVHVEYYAARVAEASERRRWITIGGQIAGLGWAVEDDLADIRQKIQQLVLSNGARHTSSTRRSLTTALESYYDRIAERRATGALGGIATGLRDLDDCIDGLTQGHVIVLSAPSSGGKSAFGLTLGLNAAAQRKQVLVFSLEMSDDDYCQRVLAYESRLSGALLRTGQLDDAEWGTLQDAFGTASAQYGPYFTLETDPTLTVAEMFEAAWAHQAAQGLDLVIVDYAQLVEHLAGRGADRHELGVKATMAGLLRLAKTLQVPVVVLSQENDDGQTRESRTIEHTAHEWLQIRADLDPARIPPTGRVSTDLVIRKNRNGPKSSIPVWWNLKTNRFEPRSTIYGG
jgi:replicative DNA helicase